MRVIFLEFDGVLHPFSATSRFAPVPPFKRAIERAWLFRWAWILDDLLEGHPDVGIVTHSNWRQLIHDDDIQSFLGPLARRFAGSTPRAPKWNSILQVVQGNSLQDFRILDASPQAFPPGLPELIACDSEIGLREYGVQKQIQRWLQTAHAHG
ncbi:MAG: hypothetical protein JWQ23_1618 [Herminiimonas sp.]|jgi:hypothetical protein|nr:hypothetical protein [Herminiimonas sp.]